MLRSSRYSLLACVLGLFLLGCAGKPDADDSNTTENGGGDDKAWPVSKMPSDATSAVKVAHDFLSVSYRGDQFEILSSEEHATKFGDAPATALHLEWRLKDGGEVHNELLLIQDNRVIGQFDFDPGKPLDANAKAAVKELATN